MDINNYTPTRETTHWSVPFERNATFQNTNDWHDCSECLTTQTVFFQVTTADALEVISTSASDGVAGIGTQTVSVVYLNASNVLTRTTVTMNGTTAVPLTGITANAIISMYALTGGTNLVSVGSINLRKVGTPTTIYEQIEAGGNRSRSGRITCPIGFYINVKTICVSVQGQSIEVVPRVTRDPFNGATISQYLYEGITKLASGTNGEIKAEGLRLDVGQTLKMSAKTDNTANARVFGSVNMELVSL